MPSLFTAFLKRRYRALIAVLLSFGLTTVLGLATISSSGAVPITAVPNPQEANGGWVSDMAEMLSTESEAQLNQIISDLEAVNGAEIAVVTVPNTQPSASPKEFATELFNAWGIGKVGEDNGVLFLVSKGDRRTEVETGYGIEGILPDAKVGRILDTQVTPQFKAGNFDGGILAGTAAIVTAIAGETVELPAGLIGQGVPAGAIAQSPPTANAPTPLLTTKNTRPARNLSAESTSFRGFLSVLFAGLFAGVIAGVIALKPLRTGKLKPRHIKPVGHSRISKIGNLSFYLWARAWIGDQKSTRYINGGGFFSLFNKSLYGKTNQTLATKSSWLTVHYRNQQFTIICAVLLGGLVVFSIALTGFGFGAIALSPLLVWAWLAIELWLSNTQANVKNPLSRTIQGIFFISLSAIFLLIVFAPFTMGLSLLGSPFLLIPVCGATAGLLRFFRISEQGYDVLCTECDRPMQQLTVPQLNPHMRPPEKVEVTLKTKAYEGWCCPACSPDTPDNVLHNRTTGEHTIHLFSFGLNRPGFRKCKACQALTVEVKKRVIRAATTRASGTREVVSTCHCCHAHNRKTITIPRKSSSTSSSSSHSSGSSGSSGGSSGGSFGGGSSGGGGAGSSW